MSVLEFLNKAKKIGTQLKDAVLQTTPMEKKVRDATDNSSWGPTVTQKQEIAASTMHYTQFKEIMGVIWKRLGEEGRSYKCIQKALGLLLYLMFNGSDNVLHEVRREKYSFQRLSTFYYTDHNGREVGSGVRQNAKEILKCLRDKDYYRSKKKESRKVQSRFKGYSKKEVHWKRSFDDNRQSSEEEEEEDVRKKARSPPKQTRVVEKVLPPSAEEDSSEEEEEVEGDGEVSNIRIKIKATDGKKKPVKKKTPKKKIVLSMNSPTSPKAAANTSTTTTTKKDPETKGDNLLLFFEAPAPEKKKEEEEKKKDDSAKNILSFFDAPVTTTTTTNTQQGQTTNDFFSTNLMNPQADPKMQQQKANNIMSFFD